MSQTSARPVSAEDVPPNTRRGGDLRALLTPTTVGATSGFLGEAVLAPDEVMREHYHPYSEEFLYLVSGGITVQVEGEPVAMTAGQALLLPRGTRHRLHNHRDVEAKVVFALSPLAPRPELGHVDTEPMPEPAQQANGGADR